MKQIKDFTDVRNSEEIKDIKDIKACGYRHKKFINTGAGGVKYVKDI